MANVTNVDVLDGTALANLHLLEDMTWETAKLITEQKQDETVPDPKLLTMALFKLGRTVHALEASAATLDDPCMAFVHAEIQKKLGNWDAERRLLENVVGTQQGAEDRLAAIKEFKWLVPNAYEDVTDLSPNSKLIVFYCTRSTEPWTDENVRVRFLKNQIQLEISFAHGAVYTHSYYPDGWTVVLDQTKVVVHPHKVEITVEIHLTQ